MANPADRSTPPPVSGGVGKQGWEDIDGYCTWFPVIFPENSLPIMFDHSPCFPMHVCLFCFKSSSLNYLVFQEDPARFERDSGVHSTQRRRVMSFLLHMRAQKEYNIDPLIVVFDLVFQVITSCVNSEQPATGNHQQKLLPVQ